MVEFSEIKKKIEETYLPHLKELKLIERDNVRTKIRYIKTEEEAQDILIKLSKLTGQAFSLEYIKEQIKPDNSKILREVYDSLIIILKRYCDLEEDYYPLISLWVIGTYCHKSFLTYPYLFFNALKGSGKTRTLSLIAELSWHGELINSINEAVLFRTAKDSTFCFDEFEDINSKEKEPLRTLINSAYKKGMKVKRMRKRHVNKEEQYEVESFDVYCPIAMANIKGIDNTLGDRCIQIVLKRSSNTKITSMPEFYEIDPEIQNTKKNLDNLFSEKVNNRGVNNHVNNHEINNAVSVVSDVSVAKEYYTTWIGLLKSENKLGDDTYNTNNTNDTSLNIKDTSSVTKELKNFFIKVSPKRFSYDSRFFEICFPLFILANIFDNSYKNIVNNHCHKSDLLTQIFKATDKLAEERKQEDISENRDINLLKYISEMEESNEFINLKTILKGFIEEYADDVDVDSKYITIKWLGRALKRLGVIYEKRRLRAGREVLLNYQQAKKSISLFQKTKDLDKSLDTKPEKIETPTINNILNLDESKDFFNQVYVNMVTDRVHKIGKPDKAIKVDEFKEAYNLG